MVNFFMGSITPKVWEPLHYGTPSRWSSRLPCMGVRRNLSRGGATSTFCLSFSCCWRCNANAPSWNALPFLNHNDNAPCYGNSRKNRASLAQQCFFFIYASFHTVQNYKAYHYQQSLSRSIFYQRSELSSGSLQQTVLCFCRGAWHCQN